VRIGCHVAALQPAGLGIGADEQEQLAQRALLFGAAAPVAPGERLQPAGQHAVQGGDFGVRAQHDIVRGGGAIDVPNGEGKALLGNPVDVRRLVAKRAIDDRS
jgi:hypothetical protein